MVRISKTYRILISALLALLGFSCGNGRELPVEYGTPKATYKAKGVVVSEEDNSPIKGICAQFTSGSNTVYTGGNGSFSLEGDEFPRQKLYVKLIDVDGEENGSFAGMEIEADFTNAAFTGGDGHWYEGKAEKDLGIIKMRPEN